MKRQRYDPEYQQYTVHLRRRLRQGNIYLLSLHFQSMLGNATKGFFVTTYKDKEGNERFALWDFSLLTLKYAGVSCFIYNYF